MTIAAGVVILAWPSKTLYVASLLLGVAVALRGGFDIWSGLKRRNELGANVWVFVRGLILITIGGFIFLIAESAVTAAIVGGSLVMIGRAVIAIAFASSDSSATSKIDASDTYAVVAYWLKHNEMSEEEAAHVNDRVFLHQGNSRDRITRFSILMALATAIATFGIATDSTAVVIGAMLVAPLMTPILGTSAGLINGRTRAAGISAMIVISGAVVSVAIAWLLSALIPDLTAVVGNSQVMSRTAPSLLDLAIAVLAGIAGAYSVSRAESSDALPGVAVAIALVPPLAVVGVTIHAGEYGLASGAALLFLTNLFSIVLMAGIVFLLVGYGTSRRLYDQKHRIRTSFALVVLAVVLIAIPLALTGQHLLSRTADLRNASEGVDDWLAEAFEDTEEPPLRINTIEVDGDTIEVQLVGHAAPPSSSRLAQIVSESMGRQIVTNVRWIEERLDIGVPPP